jgi:hypothetical protein
MTRHPTKFFSAAVIAAALIATVAIARTVHTQVAAPLHGSIACGTMSYAACEKLEQMLPM